MNNILWLVNPVTFKEKEFYFPAYLCRLNNSTLSVITMHATVMHELKLRSNDIMFPTSEFTISGAEQEVESELFEKGIELLKKCGEENGVSMQIKYAVGDPLQQMVEESMFADLIIVHAGLTFAAGDTFVPSEFVMNVLPHAKCPVIVMPENMQEIKELFFTYNGKYSSVYSIRQFSYIFPQLKDLPVTILTSPEDDEVIPYKENLKQLLKKHYSDVTFKILNGDVENALIIELMSKKNAVVTFGAFGRSKLSRFLRRSNADSVLQVINLPIFITHP